VGARGGVGGLFGGGGAQGGSPFDDLFFPLAVLAPLPGVAFAGRFPVVLRAHILKRTPFLNTPPLVQPRAVTAWSVRRGCTILQTFFRPAVRVQVNPADGYRSFFFGSLGASAPTRLKTPVDRGIGARQKKSCRPGVVPWT